MKDLLEHAPFHDLQQVVFPVIGRQGTVAKVWGTAFGISSDLAITASHVADDAPVLDEMALLHVGKDDTGALVRSLLPVVAVSSHGTATDAAVLSVALPVVNGKPLRIGALRIGFAPPDIGEPCVTLGYTLADPSGQPIELADVDSVVNMTPKFFSSGGTVVDHYPTGVSLCRFPCFQVDGEVRSQMSGGPVLFTDTDGMMVVRGLISSGSDSDAVGGPFYFPSMMYPAAALEPGASHGAAAPSTRESLLDLALAGELRSVDASIVDLDTSDPDRPVVGLSSPAPPS